MWFGESEKKIKQIFDDYREIVNNSNHPPILLFNEADAVFSKRKDIGSSGVDKTENAIQNIILEELESINGILIATTNLTHNLDKAFERRFLYKIEFTKPSVNIKSRIWADHIKDLKPSQAMELANRFDFTGGQIANIARKYIMNNVLNNLSTNFNNIVTFCEQEGFYTNNNKRKIGF